jgi:hypothetical protein
MAYNNEFKFEIVKNIATLSTERSGWTKEVNLVSYNDAPPKFDIRSWDPNHEKMGKGITLSRDEMKAFLDAMADEDI